MSIADRVPRCVITITLFTFHSLAERVNALQAVAVRQNFSEAILAASTVYGVVSDSASGVAAIVEVIIII